MSRDSSENRENTPTNNILLFHHAISNCFENIADSVSEEEFIRTLTALESNLSVGRRLHQAMKKVLYETMNADLENILKDDSLSNAFSKIAKLTEGTDISENEKAWRPPGDVQMHMRSLDAEVMLEQIKKLEERVNHLENENEELKQIVKERRNKLNVINEQAMHLLKKAPFMIQRLEKLIEQLENCHDAIDSEFLNLNESNRNEES